jgi:protein involved in polysaccharide export with SLBB domain
VHPGAPWLRALGQQAFEERAESLNDGLQKMRKGEAAYRVAVDDAVNVQLFGSVPLSLTFRWTPSEVAMKS